MAENKSGFVLYADQKEVFEALPDEQAGKLIKHIFKYVNDENPSCEDPYVNIAFIGIKQALKRDLKKWEARAERSRLNGAKGGRPKKPKEKNENPENPVGFSGNPDEPKKPDSVSVSVSVNDSVSVKENKSRGKRFSPPTHEEINSYCSEVKIQVDAERFIDFYSAKGWMIGKNKMKDWKAACRNWAKRNNSQQSQQHKFKSHINKDQDEW